MHKRTSLKIAGPAILAVLLASPAWAQTAAPRGAVETKVAALATPTARPTAKPAPQPARAKPAVRAPAKAAAVGGAAAAVALSPGQLDAAQRVYTGKADCEFGEQIDVSAVDGRPGHFQLRHKRATYQLVPEETTTGAVRLEDKRSGIVWLQIPAKSMLMNSKIGQRVADNCQMSQQKG